MLARHARVGDLERRAPVWANRPPSHRTSTDLHLADAREPNTQSPCERTLPLEHDVQHRASRSFGGTFGRREVWGQRVRERPIHGPRRVAAPLGECKSPSSMGRERLCRSLRVFTASCVSLFANPCSMHARRTTDPCQRSPDVRPVNERRTAMGSGRLATKYGLATFSHRVVHERPVRSRSSPGFGRVEKASDSAARARRGRVETAQRSSARRGRSRRDPSVPSSPRR